MFTYCFVLLERLKADRKLTHPLISNDLEKAAERRALGYGFSEAGHQWS
jgi:hypothetical protein